MAFINQMLRLSMVGLCLLSCASQKTSLVQQPATEPTPEAEVIDVNNEEPLLPIKKREQSASELPSPPRSEVFLPDSYDEADGLPVVSRLAEATTYDGKLVRLIGQYVERDSRMQPGGTPRYVGHVSIILADDTRVSLWPMWKHEARRPEQEIDRFKNHEVEVVGIFNTQAPVDPSGGASMTTPCLTEVKALYIADTTE